MIRRNPLRFILFLALAGFFGGSSVSAAIDEIKTDRRGQITKARGSSFGFRRYDRLISQGIGQYRSGLYSSAVRSFSQVARAGNDDQKRIAEKYIARIQKRRTALRPGRRKKDDAGERAAWLSGYIKSEDAWDLHWPMRVAKLKHSAYLANAHTFSQTFSYQVSGRFFYDNIFDVTERHPKAVEEDERQDAELRDAFIDLSWRSFDLRLGKQQVVWGESVGLFYADVVNARDLREFILQDFDVIRIPQWAADLEYSGPGYHAELVFVPVLEFDRVPRPGSDWQLPLPVSTAVLRGFNEEVKPADQFRNAELGGRFNVQLAGWDLGVLHWSGWDTFPALERSTSPTGVTLTPVHKRMNTEGVTFSKEAWGVVLRGEGIYQSKKYLPTSDPRDRDGLDPKNVWDYYVGADATLLQTVDVTAQAGRRYIQGWTPDIIGQKRFTNNYVGSVRMGFASNRIEIGGTIIVNTAPQNYLLRPKGSVRLGDHMTFSAGVDIFHGRPDTFFGYFDDRDRIYGELRFDF